MTADLGNRPAGLWLDALERLVITSCAAPPEKEAVCLGLLLNLLHGAPELALFADLALPSRQAESLLTDNQACSSIALSLLEGHCSFMISKSAEQLYIASVMLPNSEEETTASGSTFALALIGAIALAVVDLALCSRIEAVRSASA